MEPYGFHVQVAASRLDEIRLAGFRPSPDLELFRANGANYDLADFMVMAEGM